MLVTKVTVWGVVAARFGGGDFVGRLRAHVFGERREARRLKTERKRIERRGYREVFAINVWPGIKTQEQVLYRYEMTHLLFR